MVEIHDDGLINFRDNNYTVNNYTIYQTECLTATLNELAYFVMTRPIDVVIDHFPFRLRRRKGNVSFNKITI